MVSALKTELLRAMTLVILSSLSAYKEKEYVRPGNGFQKFCFCCPVSSFYFCSPFLPISDYALCLEKLSLRPCALLLTAPLYPALLPLRQLLRLFLLSLRLLIPKTSIV